MFLTKSSSYVLSSTYNGQKDNTVMCLQEVLKKTMDNLSPVSRSLWFATEGDWEEKKRKALGFPLSTVHFIISILIGKLR